MSDHECKHGIFCDQDWCPYCRIEEMEATGGNAKIGMGYDDKFHSMEVGKLRAEAAELEAENNALFIRLQNYRLSDKWTVKEVDEMVDRIEAQDAQIKRLRDGLLEIRDSTMRDAVRLRAMAGRLLEDGDE